MIESVSGGSIGAAAIEIHAEDQARIGQLMLNRGRLGRRRVLPERVDREIADAVRAAIRTTGCCGG